MNEVAELRRRALQQAAIQLALTLTDGQIERLLGYLDLLQRWNGTYNLTAVRDAEDMLRQHLFDCLAVIGPLYREAGESGRLLDVGSGGGLPGVVVAAVCPGWEVVCVDTVGKKAAFIQQVAAELRLPQLRAQHGRVEQLKMAPVDVITSRAFASLPDFVSLTRQHLAASGVWMAMKGKRPQEEMDALMPESEVFHVEQLRVPQLDAERCLVWIRPTPSMAKGL